MTPIRLMSIVEALTVTGPVKPLLMFSALMRDRGGARPFVHRLVTTRRHAIATAPDELQAAAAAIALEYRVVPERRAFDPRILGRLVREIREFAPGIIETHDCKSHFLFWLLRARYPDLRRAKWVAFHHGYTRTSLRVRAYQQLDRLSLRSADRVVTLCRPFAAQLAARGVDPRRISVIANAVAMRARPAAGEVAELRSSLGIAPGERVILAVGRLSREKGYDHLIGAYARFLEGRAHAGARLVLVGDGPERAELQRLGAALGDRIVFAGQRPDPWVFYHAADIFVLSSLTEGSPLVLLEAMAAGLPIIATAVGGVPETLNHETSGLLIPPGDRPALSEALARLDADATLRERLGREASRAVREHTPERYAEQLLAIYAGAGAGGAGATP